MWSQYVIVKFDLFIYFFVGLILLFEFIWDIVVGKFKDIYFIYYGGNIIFKVYIFKIFIYGLVEGFGV